MITSKLFEYNMALFCTSWLLYLFIKLIYWSSDGKIIINLCSCTIKTLTILKCLWRLKNVVQYNENILRIFLKLDNLLLENISDINDEFKFSVLRCYKCVQLFHLRTCFRVPTGINNVEGSSWLDIYPPRVGTLYR